MKTCTCCPEEMRSCWAAVTGSATGRSILSPRTRAGFSNGTRAWSTISDYPMRDFIVFRVNGREFRIGRPQIFTTLANWLRYDECATGTKIVCEEGDCGACTVLIRRSPDENFASVNSCIQSLFQLDGASIITVEGLKENGALTAVQQAMVV